MLCLIHFWVLNVWHFPSHVLFSFLQPPTPVPLTAPLYLKYPLSLCVSNLLFSSGWHFHLFISFSIKKKIFWWPILKFLFNLLQYYFCFFFFWPRGMCNLSSLTRDWPHSPCIGSWSLNHWASWEIPGVSISENLSVCCSKAFSKGQNHWSIHSYPTPVNSYLDAAYPALLLSILL